MRSMYKPNISATGRLASSIAGAALAIVGYQRSNKALGLAGLGLIARGASGWCPVTAAFDSDAQYDTEATKRHLGGSRGVIVEDAITIYRPVSEVYAYWRNLENLPRFMDHLEEVRVTDRFRSHWVAAVRSACASNGMPRSSTTFRRRCSRGNRWDIPT